MVLAYRPRSSSSSAMAAAPARTLTPAHWESFDDGVRLLEALHALDAHLHDSWRYQPAADEAWFHLLGRYRLVPGVW
jgi:hypothetical protein